MMSFVFLTCTVFCICTVSGQEKVFPDHGLSIEARGQVLYSQTVLSIPAVLSLGNLSMFFLKDNLTGCALGQAWGAQQHIADIQKAVRSNLGELFQKGYQEELENFVCNRFSELCHGNRTSTDPIRHKRFIFSLGAMIGAGVGAIGYWMYNRIAGYDASSAIADMKNSFDSLKDIVSSISKAQLMQTKAMRQMWAYSLSLRKDLEMLRLRMVCHKLESQQEASYLQLLSLLPNQFHRAVNSIIRSEVTPDLISYDQVKHLISEHPGLKNTLFAKDYALFYQLSHVIPVMIDQESLSLYFLLQVPHLAPESLGVLYEMYNFGSYHEKYHAKVDVPQYFAKFMFPNQNYQYFPVVPSECHKTPGVWVCSYGGININEHSGCISSIMRDNNFTTCKTQVRKNVEEQALLVTSSGAFVFTPSKPYTTINYTTWSKVPKFHEPSKTTRFIPLSTFDELIVGNQHIQGHRYNFSIPIITTSGFQLSHLSYNNYSFIPYDWRETNQVSSDINKTQAASYTIFSSIEHLKSPSFWYSHSIATATLIIFGIIVVIILWKIRTLQCSRSHGKLGRRHNKEEIAIAMREMSERASTRSRPTAPTGSP